MAGIGIVILILHFAKLWILILLFECELLSRELFIQDSRMEASIYQVLEQVN